jgi:hypothetical protein
MTIKPRVVRALRDARSRLRDAAIAEHSLATHDGLTATEHLASERGRLETILDDAHVTLASARNVHDLGRVADLVTAHHGAIAVAVKLQSDAAAVTELAAAKLRARRALRSPPLRARREDRAARQRRPQREAPMIRATSYHAEHAAPADRAERPERNDRDAHADRADRDARPTRADAHATNTTDAPAPPATGFRAHLATLVTRAKTTAADAAPPALQPQQQAQPLPVELAAAGGSADAEPLMTPTDTATAAAPTAAPATNPATMQMQQPALTTSALTDTTDPASSMQVEVDQQADSVKSAPALTPLEQAVHDLISQMPRRDHDDHPDATISASEPHVAHTSTPTPVVAPASQQAFQTAGRAPVLAPAPISEPRALPEQSVSSHLHLVLGDDADRVVVTVAVRGENVNVTMRGTDDATTAALARNAGSLDHAMRARGLNLAELNADRDPDRRRNSDQPAREREQPQDSRPFILEEAS